MVAGGGGGGAQAGGRGCPSKLRVLPAERHDAAGWPLSTARSASSWCSIGAQCPAPCGHLATGWTAAVHGTDLEVHGVMRSSQKIDAMV